MTQVKFPLSLQCPDPDHSGQIIGTLDVNPKARKIGYCHECLDEKEKDDEIILKSVSKYLKDKSDFYDKCRERVRDCGEAPAELIEELSKKGERLEKFSQHIEQEKDKVKRSFEEIRRIVQKIMNEKEKECLELLDKELLDLSQVYKDYEKLLIMSWPKPVDIPNVYPEIEKLKQRMSEIGSLDQLRAFIARIHEDMNIQDLYFKEDDGLFKIKKKLDGLIQGFNIPEGSFPKIQSGLLNSENLENIVKDLMRGLSQQEVQVENSFESRMKALAYESKIISNGQFITLKDWLPKGYKFDLKLLYRGSEDGMSKEKLYQKCNDKGATITLTKCQFVGAASSSILGGFLDKIWNSNQCYTSSEKAFLFSLGEQQANSIKCPIVESEFGSAFYGDPNYGPIFGGGHDFYIHQGLQTGTVNPKSYSNAIALRGGAGEKFTVEEIEIYQVL